MKTFNEVIKNFQAYLDKSQTFFKPIVTKQNIMDAIAYYTDLFNKEINNIKSMLDSRNGFDIVVKTHAKQVEDGFDLICEKQEEEKSDSYSNTTNNQLKNLISLIETAQNTLNACATNVTLNRFNSEEARSEIERMYNSLLTNFDQQSKAGREFITKVQVGALSFHILSDSEHPTLKVK